VWVGSAEESFEPMVLNKRHSFFYTLKEPVYFLILSIVDIPLYFI
jgi:hypothetical protein